MEEKTYCHERNSFWKKELKKEKPLKNGRKNVLPWQELILVPFKNINTQLVGKNIELWTRFQLNSTPWFGISEHFFLTLTAVLLLCISYFHDSCQYEYKIQRIPGPVFCIFFVLSLSISGSNLLSITDILSLSNLWFDSLITWLIFPTVYLLSSSNSETILIPLLT